MRYYIGIDVGADGAISSLDGDGNIIMYDKFPKDTSEVASTIVNHISVITCNEDFEGLTVGVEDVHSLFVSSKKSNFIFGQNKGIILGILNTIQLTTTFEIVMVHAKVWQNKVWLSQDKVLDTLGRSISTNTKATSLNAAKRLYPSESFLASTRSRVPHDGIVDATLLAKSLIEL